MICELSWVTGSWYQERDIAVKFFRCIFIGGLSISSEMPSCSIILEKRQTTLNDGKYVFSIWSFKNIHLSHVCNICSFVYLTQLLTGWCQILLPLSWELKSFMVPTSVAFRPHCAVSSSRPGEVSLTHSSTVADIFSLTLIMRDPEQSALSLLTPLNINHIVIRTKIIKIRKTETLNGK